jgi:hypothetical protein
MRSCLAKKVLPVIAVFGAACGGAGSFSDDPVGALPVILCATGSTADWRGWISYYSPPLVLASWAAIQRENQSWHTIDATEAKVFLNPGEKIGLARWLPAQSTLGVPSAEIFFVTAEQAQAAFPCDSSRKSLHGTVQGLETGQGGYLSIGNSVRTFSNGPFTMDGVSPGMTDLVATRLDAPAKAILRHGVDYPNGSEISLLDFGSAEAVSLEPHTLAVNDATTQFEARSQIITQLGADGFLSRDFAITGAATRTVTMYSVPESSLTNDDVQFLSVDPQDYRFAIVFYRHPADRTVTLGPGATTATGTHLGTAFNRTLRLDMPSQPEYGAQVSFSLCSGSGNSYAEARLLVTKEYFGGTPPTWSVTVPDLKSVQGFPGGDLRAHNLCSVQSLTNLPFVFAPRTTHEGDAFTFLTYGNNVSNK